MWNIWKEELYKIAAHKIIWTGTILLLAFVSFRLFSEQNTYTMTIDGKTFYGREAVRKDQELSKIYAGALTKEKIQQIYKEYGFYHYDGDKKIVMGNFCNRYITEKFTNYMQTEGNDPDETHFYEGEDWELYAAPYLENEPWFDYIYGWNDFAEMYIFTLAALFIILLIGLSPVFAEEYQLKTADILKTTCRGKGGGVWLKMLAALFFALTLTCLVSAYLWGIYLAVYGTQGLDASAILLNFTTFYGYCPRTVLGFFVFITFLGLAGTALLTGIVSGISAFCKTPFLALVISLAAFLFPFVWVKVFGPMGIFGPVITKNVTHFMISMPLYLPMSTGFAFSAEQLAIHLCIALITGTAGVLLGYYRYRNF